jgi:thiol-disulfide isomerase/thioredoxin
MAILTKHSVIGFVCGVLCTLLLEGGAALLFMNSFSAEDGDTPSMEAPFMPPSSRLGNLEGEFLDLRGQKTRFADLRGKVVVLNLWATWCPPCRAEMPSLDNLWKTFQGRDDIAVLCISEEAAEDVRAHPVSRNVTMPLYVFGSEPPAELNAPALPTTFIFDQDGRMIFEHTGMAQWDAPEVVEFLNSQLAAQRERRE